MLQHLTEIMIMRIHVEALDPSSQFFADVLVEQLEQADGQNDERNAFQQLENPDNCDPIIPFHFVPRTSRNIATFQFAAVGTTTHARDSECRQTNHSPYCQHAHLAPW